MSMGRFVILRHETAVGGAEAAEGIASTCHWDFMIEVEGALWTWALAQDPRGSTTSEARRLPDHREAYLEYEGPLTDGRGTVSRVDWGRFTWLARQDALVVVQLDGRRFHGTAALTRAPGTLDCWHWEFSTVDSGSRP